MSHLSHEDFEIVVDKTFQAIGIEPDPDTFHYEHNHDRNFVAGQDVSGVNDIYIAREWRQDTLTEQRPLEYYDVNNHNRYYFNDLLCRKMGTYIVKAASNMPLYAFEKKHKVRVKVFSSPQRINSLQSDLGREPGVDAFRLQRLSGKGVYTPGEWLEGAANMEIRVADLVHSFEAQHDTNPADHVQSWYITPPVHCKAIANRAQQLIELHGDAIHESKGVRPVAVDGFADALDTLSTFTFPLVDTLSRIGVESDLYSRSPMVGLHDEMHYKSHYVIDKRSQERRKDTDTRVFEQLGILKPGFTGEARLAELRRLSAIYVASAANMLLTIEELRPRDNEASRAKASRLRLLNGIAQKYSVEAA